MEAPPASRRSLTANDRRLLERLVRECGPRLLAYVRHVHGNRFDAEELLAEALCRAASNMAALRRCDRHDLYLLRIVRNLCCDGWRRSRDLGAGRSRPEQGSESGPEELLSQREQQAILRQAVAKLPQAQREVVVLRLTTDLKFEEIAALLDVPLGTVLSRMHAAVRRLRERIGCTREC